MSDSDLEIILKRLIRLEERVNILAAPPCGTERYVVDVDGNGMATIRCSDYGGLGYSTTGAPTNINDRGTIKWTRANQNGSHAAVAVTTWKRLANMIDLEEKGESKC